MSVLFIDSSYDITIGLLDEEMEWFDLRTFKGQKASATLQVETHRILSESQIKAHELKSVVSVAGPGFYTGLRLSEGFSDVTSFFQIPHFSFYSHEVPEILGVSEGTWMTKAYRGEYFIYEWKRSENSTHLLSAKELEAYSPKGEVFIHSETSLDEKLLSKTLDSKSTIDLIRLNSKSLFDYVLKNSLKRESYYFRAPEDEFRMNP